MGLTKEQWHKKRTDEIMNYVLSKGDKVSATMTYWHTYPVVVKDICVLGVMVKGQKNKKVLFGDMIDKKFVERKTTDQLERSFLEDILVDMKEADKKHSK